MSESLWTADELQQICQAQWVGPRANVDGLSYLPNRVRPGDLFVALRVDGTDHHESIGKAIAKGARAALVTKLPTRCRDDTPLLLTRHMRKSLRQLGVAARSRTQAKLIGITGRAGKTFTKNALAELLACQGRVSATEANDNDTTGVYITLARMPSQTDFGVLEISMAMFGDVANSVYVKSAATQPDVAVITRIGTRENYSRSYERHHLEVAAVKARIFDGLKHSGTAIINRDDADVFGYLDHYARSREIRSICTYGWHPEADIRIIKTSRGREFSEATILLNGKQHSFQVGFHGEHLFENAVAVIGAIDASGGDAITAMNAFSQVIESPGRGNRYKIGSSAESVGENAAKKSVRTRKIASGGGRGRIGHSPFFSPRDLIGLNC